MYLLSTQISVCVICFSVCYQHMFLYVLSTQDSVCVINTGFCMCYQQVEVLTGAFMNRCISSLFLCCSSIPLPVTSTSIPGVYSPCIVSMVFFHSFTWSVHFALHLWWSTLQPFRLFHWSDKHSPFYFIIWITRLYCLPVQVSIAIFLVMYV